MLLNPRDLPARTPELSVMTEQIVLAQMVGTEPTPTREYVHAIQTAHKTAEIAWRVGYSGGALRLIVEGALLHDIGFSVSKTPASSTKIGEWVRNHPRVGGQFLESQHTERRYISDIAHYHQERVDGSGYPYRLSGAQVPEIAQIVSIADVAASLSLPNPYRKRDSLARPEIIEFLLREADGRWRDDLLLAAIQALQE